ncbi:MAG: hypothetical protein RIS64_2344 [Bacteroidota bacterium]|jgi:hypothetical protein
MVGLISLKTLRVCKISNKTANLPILFQDFQFATNYTNFHEKVSDIRENSCHSRPLFTKHSLLEPIQYQIYLIRNVVHFLHV